MAISVCLSNESFHAALAIPELPGIGGCEWRHCIISLFVPFTWLDHSSFTRRVVLASWFCSHSTRLKWVLFNEPVRCDVRKSHTIDDDDYSWRVLCLFLGGAGCRDEPVYTYVCLIPPNHWGGPVTDRTTTLLLSTQERVMCLGDVIYFPFSSEPWIDFGWIVWFRDDDIPFDPELLFIICWQALSISRMTDLWTYIPKTIST